MPIANFLYKSRPQIIDESDSISSFSKYMRGVFSLDSIAALFISGFGLMFYFDTTEGSDEDIVLSSAWVNFIVMYYAVCTTFAHAKLLWADKANKKGEIISNLVLTTIIAISSGMIGEKEANTNNMVKKVFAGILNGIASFVLAVLSSSLLRQKLIQFTALLRHPKSAIKKHKLIKIFKELRVAIDHVPIEKFSSTSPVDFDGAFAQMLGSENNTDETSALLSAKNSLSCEPDDAKHILTTCFELSASLKKNHCVALELPLVSWILFAIKIFAMILIAWLLFVSSLGFNCDIQTAIANVTGADFVTSLLLMTLTQLGNNLLNVLSGPVFVNQTTDACSGLWIYRTRNNETKMGGFWGQLYTTLCYSMVFTYAGSGFTSRKLFNTACQNNPKSFDPNVFGIELLTEMDLDVGEVIYWCAVAFNSLYATIALLEHKKFLIYCFGTELEKFYLLTVSNLDYAQSALEKLSPKKGACLFDAFRADAELAPYMPPSRSQNSRPMLTF